MGKIKSVEELEVFKKAHVLTLKIYKISKDFPKEEKFGLVSQMRRASASIATNLMEGGNRLNTKEFRQFVGIAKGSAGELKYHIMLANDLGYLNGNDVDVLISETEEIAKMLSGLASSLLRVDS